MFRVIINERRFGSPMFTLFMKGWRWTLSWNTCEC